MVVAMLMVMPAGLPVVMIVGKFMVVPVLVRASAALSVVAAMPMLVVRIVPAGRSVFMVMRRIRPVVMPAGAGAFARLLGRGPQPPAEQLP